MRIDYSRDKLLSSFGIATMKDRYMIAGENSPQDAFARAAKAFADDDEHAQRLYDYASKLWFMFSTPILTNGGTSKGLPISCFLNYVGDSRKSITDHYTENAFLSSLGGGIGGYWGDLRSAGMKTSKGSESTGVVPFIKVVDAEMLAFSQGITRRGAYAAYLNISHPEIEEFLDIRKPTGGDVNRRSTNLHHAVIIPDAFMELIAKAEKIPGFDDSWDLIDPHTKKVVKTVQAKTLWVKIIENRVQLGEPYIMFSDAVTRGQPWWHKELGLKVHHSNLCTEIVLPSNEKRTAVCCLSSVNIEEFDSWSKDTQFIPDLMRMLDNVLTYFIDNAPPELWKAVNSAKNERSVGLGAMGLHAYFQRHNIAYESAFAKNINAEVYAHIWSEAARADAILVKERGQCPDSEKCNAGRRFSHWLAPAPNASSSIICGNTSPSNDLYTANAYVQKTTSGSSLLKNEYLEHVLQELGMDTPEVWKDIILHKGSVQQLEFLPTHYKNVFKTAAEIDQRWVIRLAADRKICQSQSVNLFYPPEVDKYVLHRDHLLAWQLGMKTLYYLRSLAMQRAEKVSTETIRESIFKDDECTACEG